MRLAFSTLGCPGWSWEQIVASAQSMGYDGIEVRGVGNEMYLPRAEPFQAERLAATLADLRARGLALCCLGSSVAFHDATQLAARLEEGRAYIDLAAQAGVPFVRVFGDRAKEGERDAVAARIVSGLRELAAYAAPKGVAVLLETHGDFHRAREVAAILEQVGQPAAGVLWDVHHPYRVAGEAVDETYRILQPFIRHVHLKDSRRLEGGQVRYCLLGQGDVPVRRAVELLAEGGYQGWLSLEWEKRWHPEIEEPEVAFPQFVAAVRSWLR